MLSRIEQQATSLSRAERRVADWILAHPRQAADATLAEVAQACGASEPTVIRFCRSVGLNGFRELTIRLTEALSRPVSYVHRDVSADDASADAVTKVLDAAISSLMDMRAQLLAYPIDDGSSDLAHPGTSRPMRVTSSSGSARRAMRTRTRRASSRPPPSPGPMTS
jgi:DNA-binding MurR/RpiR family transcriptional regulator